MIRRTPGWTSMLALVAVVVACDHRQVPPVAEHSVAQQARVLEHTIPADTNPCAWIDSSTAARLVGPLSASPRRGHDASNPEEASDGRACVYTLRRVEPGAEGPELVSLELVTADAASEESAAQGALALASHIVGGADNHDSAASRTSDAAPHAVSKPDTGWDAVNWLPNQFVGRLGHLAVLVRMDPRGAPMSALDQDSVSRLAGIVRDRVPDLPFAAPRREWNNAFDASDTDPCTLLTRTEVESALGALAIAPFRSNGSAPLAEPMGEGCSYYTRRHRALTIKADWSEGAKLFHIQAAAARLLTTPVRNVVRNEAADTLDGPWDEAAAGMDGTLYFLRGDHMLTMIYRTAGISEGAALRLAKQSVERLR